MYLNPSQYADAFRQIREASESHSTCKLVVFVSCLDVDALCAGKILAAVCRAELIHYRLVPVAGYSELQESYKQLDDEVSSVVLLGCGASVDLEQFLAEENPGVDRRVYVIDGHRPWNLQNILGAERIVCFDDGTVDDELVKEKEAYSKLLTLYEEDDEDENQSEEDSEESGDDSAEETEPEDDSEDIRSSQRRADAETGLEDSPGSSGSSKRARKSSRKARKRRRQDIERYEQIIEQYYLSGSTITTSVTAQMYSLLSLIGQTSSEFLWLTVVGTTALDSQYPLLYQRLYRILRDEVVRLTPEAMETKASADNTSLALEEDYLLFLHRHWSLYNALYYSSYVSAKFNVWREEGRKKLHKLLAKMGISLQTAHEQWVHMDINVKRNLSRSFRKVMAVYDLDDVIRECIVKKNGYRTALSASDCVEALSALLQAGSGSELGSMGSAGVSASDTDSDSTQRPGDVSDRIRDKEKAWLEHFWTAWDALDRIELMQRGIGNAKTLQQAVFRTGAAILEKNQIRYLKIYRLAVLKDGPDLEVFRNPLALVRLGVWIAEGCAEADQTPLPLVLASLDVEADTYLVLGMAPRYPRSMKRFATEEGIENMTDAEERKLKKRNLRRAGLNIEGVDLEAINQFGVAFQQVARQSGSKVRIDSFESTIIEVRKEDLPTFLEGLTLSGLI